MHEKELKNNAKLLEEYKKAVDAGSIVSKTDLKGRITYVNHQFCEISGYTQEELLGKNHNIVRHPDVASEVYQHLWETIQRKKTWKGKIKNRAKDGSSYYVNVIIIPILDNENNLVKYLALRQNVTELEKLNNFLEKRVSEEVEKNRKKDEQSIAVLTSFLEHSPNPIVVYEGLEVQYANSKFLSLTGKSKKKIIGGSFSLSSIFDNRVGYIKELSEINPKIKTNKVSISTDEGRNIFYILVDDISSFNNVSTRMYTFNNVTLVEYQKLKINHYNERLEDFVKKVYKKECYDESNFIKDLEEKEQEDKTPKSKRTLNHRETGVLKKSRENVTLSSAQYSADIDEYILEDIEELSEIESEMEEFIATFNEYKDFSALSSLSAKLLKYGTTVSLLIEFEDLSYAIKSLATLLETIQENDVDETIHKKIELYLSNILLDLSNWRRTIFIDQVANDIHYLDSSLFSTILQFELIFNKAAVIEDEDDFELF